MTERLIHRLWLGPREMPGRYREYGRRWAELNPEHEVIEWSWHNLPPPINAGVCEDLRRRCTDRHVELATQLADVMAYELVLRYGGAAVNVDIEPVRPLSHLPIDHERDAWATYESPGRLVNAAIGGPPEHPFWQAVVDELPRRYARLAGAEMPITTGPELLTDVASRRDDIVRLPRETFCPVHFWDVPQGGTADGLWSPDSLHHATVGVHHWGHKMSGRTNTVA